MGIMIENAEIIEQLTKLAARLGTTKAEVLKQALLAETERIGLDRTETFPRERVSYRSFTLR